MDHEQDENRLTKHMAAFLRHKGLRSMQSDGYALVEDLAQSCHAEVEQILEVTRMPGKQRFQTMHDGLQVWIRATHGHTLKTVDVQQGSLYVAVKNPLPILVHAVSGESVPMVLAKGLHKGNRAHLLFSVSDEEDKLKHGFQDSCNILVYVNMTKAMCAGIPFSWAPDGMVVSAGLPSDRKNFYNKRKNDKVGTIPAEFILRVAHRGEKSTNPGASILGLLGGNSPVTQPAQDAGYPDPSQDLMRMVMGGSAGKASHTPQLRPVLPGEPAEASAEAYEQLAQMRQNQLRQLQNQEAHVRQMLELTKLKEQHDHMLQVTQHMFQQQQQVAQRNAQKTLLDTAQQVHELSRQLEATQMALGPGRRDPGPTPAMYGANEGPGGPFPPDLQHLFSLAAAAQATQGPGLGRKLQ